MLPKIEHPVIEIHLQSLDRKVKFRPFLVKEEKLLLIAKESEDINEIRSTIKQIIVNCLLEDLNVEALPLFDVEMIFLKLRAKSVGEAVKLVFHCENVVEGEVCNTDTDYTLNLDKVNYTVPEAHDPRIMITDTVGFKLKYTNLSNNIDFDNAEDAYDVLIDTIIDNIEYVFDGESVYPTEGVDREEMRGWLDNLTTENMNKVEEFFMNTPKVILEDTVQCKKCGFVHKLYAENLLDFFI